jgi:hypothetical protein
MVVLYRVVSRKYRYCRVVWLVEEVVCRGFVGGMISLRSTDSLVLLELGLAREMSTFRIVGFQVVVVW